MKTGATMLVPVLLYHKIDKPGDGVLVRGGFTPPARFARQLGYLKKQGFVFYTSSELVRHYREHGDFPRNGIALTLDDGWKDNYFNAFPILRQVGVKATVFLVPSCIGEVSSKAMAPGEKPRAHLSREEILEMSRWGIEFGSHTVNHRWLPDLPLPEAKYEIEESKRQLEDLVQQPCNVFAYPAGFYNEAVKDLVAGAGYQAAFTTDYGPSEPLDLFALNRIEILRRDRFLYQVGRKTKQLKS
ncbi:MAG TPA: polysaccharide deacetylase family protein [Pyrinomonadaceae bacterium]|nr:polysaccharide deacetylase family protein [Pyrinomonadaceae bacterium]